MNIAYLVWLENLSSPILKGQVVEVLEEMGRTSSEHSIHLLAFQPVYRIILRSRRLALIKRRLGAAGIRTTIIPCVAIPQLDIFRAGWFTMPFILLQSLPALLVFTLLKRIDILHCRSYPVAWSAMVLRRVLPIRLVFDPRSDFPEESVTAGKWSANSPTYRAWKLLERALLGRADATVAITDSYVDHFGRAAPEARFCLIPNNVDTNRFRRDNAFRAAFRDSRGLTEETLVFCYEGSMGGDWHNPGPYADFIVGLRKLRRPHWFLFITPDTRTLTAALARQGVRQEEYGIVTSGFEEVPSYLSAADFGTMFMTVPKIALGVKTVEYLAAGLPLIVNTNAAGAAEIVRRYQVGLVLDDERTVDIDSIRQAAAGKDEMSSVARRLAETRFSTSRVAQRYLELYDSLAF
jgi:glycosyltransferase involved in cell wall biosynthesis